MQFWLKHLAALTAGVAVGMAASQAALAQTASAGESSGDAEAGRKAFSRSCRVCHQVEAGASSAMGPSLAGIAGQPAGVDPGYAYSDALKAAAAKGLVWDEETLDKFLAAPGKFMPGTKMPLSVAAAATRRDLVAYLSTLKK